MLRGGGVYLEQHIVWVCWLQGERNAPPIIRACINSIRKYISKNVIVIDDTNYTKYVTLPEYIITKYNNGKITRTHFSDILRLALLYSYGGLWIDATVYIMGEVPKAWKESELFMFRIPSYGSEFKVTGSWWIASKCRNEVIARCLSSLFRYWQNEESLCDYYLLHKIIHRLYVKNDIRMEINEMEYSETGPAHLLREYLFDKYSQAKWDRIKAICPVQKFKSKANYQEYDKDTILAYILTEGDANS